MSNSTFDFTTSEAPTNSTTFNSRLDSNQLAILDILNFVIGLPLYSWVLWLIVTGTGSGVASELFMLNLSVCDIGNCLNSLLSIIDHFFRPLNVTQLTNFLLGLVFTGRPLFQCLMCVERYLAVVHPVTFLKYKPLRYRLICCTVAWIITLVFCLCLIFASKAFNLNLLCIILLQFLFFLSGQLFCLVAVLRVLKQSGPGEKNRERKEENHMKRRAFYLILINTVTMAVIYVPFIISGLFYILPQKQDQDCLDVGLYCFIFAGFVQPVLYLERAGKHSCLCFKKNKNRNTK